MRIGSRAELHELKSRTARDERRFAIAALACAAAEAVQTRSSSGCLQEQIAE